MRLMFQLEGEEQFVVLLPGEWLSNAIMFDVKLSVFPLSSLGTFYSILYTDVSMLPARLQ